MKSRLLKLLYDYSVNGKLVDGKFITELIDIVVESKQVDDYLCGLIITDKDHTLRDPDSILAAYYPNKKLITIYMEAIMTMIKGYSVYEGMFTPYEQTFYKNLLVTQTILHELEHANQRKLIKEGTSLEAKILRASDSQVDQKLVDKLARAGLTRSQIQTVIETQMAKNDEAYIQIPDERLAEIKSHQELVTALSEIEDKVPNLLNFEKTNVLETKLSGYTYDKGRIVSPTLEYITSTGKGFALQKFEWFNKDHRICLDNVKEALSLDERLMYGLPIDKTEFIRNSQTLLSSKKYNI